MINGIIVFIIAIVVFFWWKGRQKTKAEAWSGVVEDKQEKSITDSEGNDTTWYMLTVKLDDGSTKEVEVKHKVYRNMNVGDKIVKNSGELNPTKG